MYKNTWMKFQMYLSSLWLLFLMLIVVNVDIPIDFSKEASFIGLVPLLKRNIIPCISIIMLGISTIFVKTFNHKISSGTQEYFEIKEIKNKTYEHLTFLTTYIIPLICFDLSKFRYTLVLLLLLIVIAIIYVKTDIYYANPTLAILGYHLYEADVELRDEKVHESCILITRDKIKQNSKLEYLQIDDEIFFVKEKAHE
ncbi:anti-phage protein KwaA [Anaerocolumna sp.]|uniref:anti-phage protein KwaA n=1 Tax=Anaerocolumna sp. TaxID=2041569 RepID=UPI0028AE85B1|nr:anti-phage protein KwaA [Anaerocolumna sp.]